MLFNSFEFIALFLPITAILYFLLVRIAGIEYGIGILVVASLFFYAYWNPIYIVLIVASIGVNYFFGTRLLASNSQNARFFLVLGISINLLLLAYFKYANFFVDNVNAIAGTEYHLKTIILPLAISFFTFQQISYLVDARRGKTSEYNFLHYCLFVCFFPQLIAGPIVHHKEMLPQFAKAGALSPKWSNIAIGVSIFAIGLFKKTVIADGLSQYVSPIYDNPAIAGDVDFFTAWGSTLAYTFQLYFDFSGYSDMAIGSARIFGIKLPVNFFSPYKSVNIIDFWRRWHITLSRFLRDYLYIALGGSRSGKVRRYRNLFVTMLLGGLWHGAGWTFVIWGALHGSYLIINHAWQHVMATLNFKGQSALAYRFFSWAVTFLAVVIGWVYFRAPSVEQANAILAAMLGANGAELPNGLMARLGPLANVFETFGIVAGSGSGLIFVGNYLWIILAASVALLLPNVAQIFHRQEPVLYEKPDAFSSSLSGRRIAWLPTPQWAFASALMLVLGFLTLTQISEFLYFQF